MHSDCPLQVVYSMKHFSCMQLKYFYTQNVSPMLSSIFLVDIFYLFIEGRSHAFFPFIFSPCLELSLHPCKGYKSLEEAVHL